jgi:hypothetical protein
MTVIAMSMKRAHVEKAVAKKIKDLEGDGFNIHRHEITAIKEGLGERANVSVKMVYDPPSCSG